MRMRKKVVFQCTFILSDKLVEVSNVEKVDITHTKKVNFHAI